MMALALHGKPRSSWAVWIPGLLHVPPSPLLPPFFCGFPSGPPSYPSIQARYILTVAKKLSERNWGTVHLKLVFSLFCDRPNSVYSFFFFLEEHFECCLNCVSVVQDSYFYFALHWPLQVPILPKQNNQESKWCPKSLESPQLGKLKPKPLPTYTEEVDSYRRLLRSVQIGKVGEQK